MLRALGFGCCASAPFDVFFCFFGRGAAYSILALRASLVSLRRRDVRLLHSVLGKFDVSFSRVKRLTGCRSENWSVYGLKLELYAASSP